MKNKLIFIAFLIFISVINAFSQDETTNGKVVNANRQEIGKAEVITDSSDFGFYIKMWLNGGKLRIIRQNSDSRSSTLSCSFREY